MEIEHASKDDYLGLIWANCSKLTDEAMKLASTKASESAFDLNRGIIPLAESFINLSSGRAILEDAIEKQKLVQLPITVQREILANLESISKSLLGLTNGVDEVATLTSGIEALNTSIWKYGLHNLSEQVLGYQKKLNQLKNQETQLARLLTELETARQRAERVAALSDEFQKLQSQIVALVEQAKQNAAAIGSTQEQTKEIETKASANLATIQQNEKQSGELIAGIRTAHSDLLALDSSIRKFYAEVDEYRKKILETSDAANKLISDSKLTIDSTVEGADKELKGLKTELEEKVEIALKSLEGTSKSSEAEIKRSLENFKKELDQYSESTIGENATKTGKLVDELASLKEQVREQIQQATGFTLFGAFQARQNQIAKSKNIWATAIGILVLISAGVTMWIAYEAKTYSAHDFAFWIKLSLTIPLGFAITFSTVQYGRERRLEEEYAFKSSISVSLNPYRDLVHSILERDAEVDKGKYTDFVIESVTRVFTSPTDRVFESERGHGLTKKTFKDAAEVIGTAVKAVK